jgi:hypothetical protein
MSDYIALAINRNTEGSLAQSARPGSPVVDDGFRERPARAVRPVRRSLAVTLRAAASAERRWADRIDPACA